MVGLLVVAAVFAVWMLPVRGTQTQIEVTSGRPLLEASDRLRNLYGKVITYEDPVWSWRDVQPANVNPNAKYGLPKPLTLALPAEAGIDPDVQKVLARTLEAYDRVANSPRFHVLRSTFGLHVVPSLIRDENGEMAAAGNPLDTKVSVPVEERRSSEHIRAVIAALEPSTGVPVSVVVAVMARQPRDPFEQLFAANPEKFLWGATNVVARDAVVELLERSATSFVWDLRCSANPRSCAFNLVPIQVAVTDLDGRKENRSLFYDRCPKCERFYPPTFAPQPPWSDHSGKGSR